MIVKIENLSKSFKSNTIFENINIILYIANEDS